jgi:hypothetical protein
MSMDLSAQLGLMIQGAEGRRIPQTLVPDTASQGLESAVGRIDDVIAGGGTPSPELLRQMQIESSRFASDYLVPNFRTGSRIQQKGAEADALYSSSKNQVLRQWSQLFVYLRNLRSKVPLPESQIRPVALRTPTENLLTTAELSFPEDKACAYSLQLLAGVAAIEAMSQPIDEFVRLRKEERTSFPDGIEVKATEIVGGFITKFQIVSSATKAVVSPKSLRVRKLDTVDWLGYSASVSACTSTEVYLSSSTIPEGTKAFVTVASACGNAYKSLGAEIDVCLAGLPSTAKMTSAVTALDQGASAAETRNLAQFLGEVAQSLYPLDIESLNSLERMGATSSTPVGSLSTALEAYAPVAGSDTKNAAIDALDSLRDDGFDMGETLLLQGNLRDFFLTDSNGASHAGQFGVAAANFSEALTTRTVPTVEGR